LLVIIIFSGSIQRKSYAQSKKDTVYYLLDTLRTPIADRMIIVESDGANKFYTTNCPCLAHNRSPLFRCHVPNQTYIDQVAFNKLKFVHLAQLIELAKQNNDYHFDDRHIVYFVVPSGKKYIMSKANYEKAPDPSDDRVIIQTDTSKQKKP